MQACQPNACVHVDDQLQSTDHDHNTSSGSSLAQSLKMAILVSLPAQATLDISVYGGALLLLAVLELTVLVRNLTRPLSATLVVALLLLSAGVFDNSLVALGASIGPGALLEKLSLVRYFLHTTLVPFLLVACAELYIKSWRAVAFVVAGVLAVSEAAMLLHAAWEPRTFAGTLRLLLNHSTEGMPFPLVTIAVSLVVLVVGWLIRRKSGDNTLLYGGLASFVGNALPASRVGTLPGALGEGLLFVSILRAERKIAGAAEQ